MLLPLLLALTLRSLPDSFPNLHSFHQENIDTVFAAYKEKTITVKLKTGESYLYSYAQWSVGYDYRNPFAPKIEDAIALLDRTFTKEEVPPSFPGGDQAWEAYLQKVFSDNQRLIAKHGPASVNVQFIVGFDGTIDRVAPMGGNAPKALTDLAIRIVKEGPAWLPATQNGHKVTAYNRLRIDFK